MRVRFADGRVTAYPPEAEDGYVAEWRALIDALEGTVEVQYDELLEDARYALRLADAAAAAILSASAGPGRGARLVIGVVAGVVSYRIAVAELPMSASLADDTAAAIVVVSGDGRWDDGVRAAAEAGAVAVIVSRPSPVAAGRIEGLVADLGALPVVVERPLPAARHHGGRCGVRVEVTALSRRSSPSTPWPRHPPSNPCCATRSAGCGCSRRSARC